MYIYIYVYIYIYIYIYTCIYIYIHTYIYTYIHTYIHIPVTAHIGEDSWPFPEPKSGGRRIMWKTVVLQISGPFLGLLWWMR